MPNLRVLGLPLRAVILLGTGGLAGVAVNALRSDGVAPGTFAAATSCSAGGEGEGQGEGGTAEPRAIAEVAAAHAAHLCGDATVMFADARSPEAFAQGHVAGAIHLPCAASGDVLGRAIDAAAGKKTLVVYGDGTADARAVATSLGKRVPAALEIRVLAGGFSAWDGAGLACSSGPCPDCGVQARDRGAAP